MRNKRKLAKRKNRIINIIENHVNKNIKEYAISVLVFFIGIIIGVMLINSSTQDNKENISGYISGFVESIKSKEYKIDEQKLLIKSILSNVKIAALIWLAGSTVIGVPIVYGAIAYKGICIGYSISSIIATLQGASGIIFSISSMLLHNIIAIPCILALSVSSIKMNKSTMKERDKSNFKYEICRHTIFSIIMTIGLLLSSFVEIFISTNITSKFIINFI